MKKLLLIIAMAGLAAGCTQEQPQPEPVDMERPNVLMIAVDDLNNWVGYTGAHPDTRTPNIDSLAQSGLRFSNYHTAASCAPTRG